MKINVLMYLFKMHNLDVLAQDKKKYSVYIALYINPIFVKFQQQSLTMFLDTTLFFWMLEY